MSLSSSQLTPGPRYDGTTLDISHAWFDIDNTLVGNNSPALPSPEFVEASYYAGKAAVLGLATARPLQKCEGILAAVELKGLSILSNGAQIYDGRHDAMIVERRIPADPAHEIIRTLQWLGLAHTIQDNGTDHFWLPEPAHQRSVQTSSLGRYATARDIWQPVSDSNQYIVNNYEPFKPLIIAANNVPEKLVPLLHEIGGQFSQRRLSSLVAHQTEQPDGTVSYEVFFVHQQANKRDALLTALEASRVSPERSMAVGDGLNDAVIVETAGVGVAMGNGVDEVKAVASYIAPSLEQNGAAVALNELVNKK